jgi:hypothetical protein
VRNVKIYGANHVVNTETVRLLAVANRNTGQRLQQWPGTVFYTNANEGKALVGSPIGATIAYFLMQHKAELRRKHITKVTVVTNEMNAPFVVHMFFHIEDMPSDGAGTMDAVDGALRKMVKKDERVVRVSRDGKNMLREHVFRL